MRAFGILGLLVVVAIIFILWTNTTSQTAKTTKEVRPQVEQLAGVDSNSGKKVTETYELTPVTEAGRFRGMKVTTLDDDSAMKTFYGLKTGDLITDVSNRGTMMMGTIGGDPEMMRSLIAEAYQTKQPLVVMRGDKKMTLQSGAGNKSNPTGTSAPPSPTKDDTTNSVQGQLDKITKPR